MLDLNSIEEIIEKKAKYEKLSQQQQEYLVKLMNDLFSSENGKKFYMVLCAWSGFYNPDNSLDNNTLRENNGKRKVISELIYPKLNKDVRRYLYGTRD